jgi:hypothetical protein
MIQIDSEHSASIQMADIAAGISRELRKRTSLVNLVRSFDYMTYNGVRPNETTAAGHEKALNTT